MCPLLAVLLSLGVYTVFRRSQVIFAIFSLAFLAQAFLIAVFVADNFYPVRLFFLPRILLICFTAIGLSALLKFCFPRRLVPVMAIVLVAAIFATKTQVLSKFRHNVKRHALNYHKHAELAEWMLRHRKRPIAC